MTRVTRTCMLRAAYLLREIMAIATQFLPLAANHSAKTCPIPLQSETRPCGRRSLLPSNDPVRDRRNTRNDIIHLLTPLLTNYASPIKGLLAPSRSPPA
jgi:hypothetical protein